jgi:CheY-like chemotaxis protein
MTTWMIVEDEPDLNELLEEIFNIWGVQTLAFDDFDEALTWIEQVDSGDEDGELPELVMLDLMFNRILRGDAVGERLRRSPRLRDMAIVIMTAQRDMPEVREEVIRKVQPDDYIQKPLPRINELQKRLEHVLERRRKTYPHNGH